MDNILSDFSAESLVKAIESNLYAWHPYFAIWPQAETYSGPDLRWSLTKIKFPLFNSLYAAHFTPENADAMIEAAINRARRHQVPLLWFTGPGNSPADLEKRLAAHGFISDEGAPGMAADLQTLPELPMIPDFQILRVSNREDLEKWSGVIVKSFEMPEIVGPAMLDWMSQAGFAAGSPLRHYLGLLNEQAVASGSMLLAEGVAGIYNVGTLPEARCKGVGLAMTLAPLLEARDLGYRIGILQATQMGMRIYRKLGFREYCQIGSFVWQEKS